MPKSLPWGITPKKAGYYWCKGRNEKKPYIAVIVNTKPIGLCFVSRNDGIVNQCDFHHYRWAGPLVPPED